MNVLQNAQNSLWFFSKLIVLALSKNALLLMDDRGIESLKILEV